MKKEILLNDLNCILIGYDNKRTIEVKLNKERKKLSLDDIFYKLNFNPIEDIEVNQKGSYIKFMNGEELVIFHQDYLKNDNIDKEILIEYIKFLETNGEKIRKKYRKYWIA